MGGFSGFDIWNIEGAALVSARCQGTRSVRSTTPPVAHQVTAQAALSQGVMWLVRWALASLVRSRRIARLLLRSSTVLRLRGTTGESAGGWRA